MPKPKMILVEIFATREIVYRQQRLMTIDDYNIIKDLQDDEVSEQSNFDAFHVLEKCINPHDVYDANEYSSVEIEPVMPEKKKEVANG